MGGASALGFEHFLISTDGVVRVLLGVLGIMSVSARYLIVSKTIGRLVQRRCGLQLAVALQPRADGQARRLRLRAPYLPVDRPDARRSRHAVAAAHERAGGTMKVTRRPNPPATALFLALLAVTLNLLQPLAHAALMRDGAPGALWSAWCKAAAADPDGSTALDGADPVTPAAAGQHDCCLGLAHAASLAAPSDDFVLLPPVEEAAPALLPATQRPAVAIRDGPPRPRGPPFSPMT